MSIYEVVGHAGMGEIKNEFDFLEYPKDHFLQSCDNMKVVGKFKDECKGQLMLRFVGLRPKLYSFDYEREAHFDYGEEVDIPTDISLTRIVLDNKVTAKGIYEYCLNSLLPKRVEIRRIGSDLHKVFTYSTECSGSDQISDHSVEPVRWIVIFVGKI